MQLLPAFIWRRSGWFSLPILPVHAFNHSLRSFCSPSQFCPTSTLFPRTSDARINVTIHESSNYERQAVAISCVIDRVHLNTRGRIAWSMFLRDFLLSTCIFITNERWWTNCCWAIIYIKQTVAIKVYFLFVVYGYNGGIYLFLYKFIPA